MVGQYLAQTNEKYYNVLQCPIRLFLPLSRILNTASFAGGRSAEGGAPGQLSGLSWRCCGRRESKAGRPFWAGLRSQVATGWARMVTLFRSVSVCSIQPLRSVGLQPSSDIVFLSHIVSVPASSHQPDNSVFLSHHSSSSLPNAVTVNSEQKP